VGEYQRGSEGKAPVLGGPRIPRELDRTVRKEVAEQLGHGRISATSAYIGTVAHMTRLDRKRTACLAEREQLLADDDALQSLAQAAGVQTFCLVGAGATGDKLPDVVLVVCEAAHRTATGHIRDSLPGSASSCRRPGGVWTRLLSSKAESRITKFRGWPGARQNRRHSTPRSSWRSTWTCRRAIRK
jgi:hypothetical protein